MYKDEASFIGDVKNKYPDKLQMHEELLRALDDCRSIRAVFDGSGEVVGTYHIRPSTPNRVRLVDVYADGRVYVCWKEVGEKFDGYFRDQLKALFDVVDLSNADGSEMRNFEGKRSFTAVERLTNHLSELDDLASSILECLNPDEQLPSSNFTEGARKTITVNSYERDRRAREECVKQYGAKCAVCEMTFLGRYGVLEGFIHIHHIKKVSASEGKEYVVNPTTDLIPLCPNCHAVAHARPELYSVAEIRELLRKHLQGVQYEIRRFSLHRSFKLDIAFQDSR